MRIAFAGTPEFAATALEALIAAGHELVLVLTQPDRPAGRGMKLQPSPVKVVAIANGLPLAQPRGLRLDGKFATDAEAAHQALQQAAPQAMVVAAYGLILPAWALALPPLGCLNIHGSLLPRWRGAAPIHRAIEAGDARTGITIMQMDQGLDTGDMLLAESVPILPDDSTGSLHDRLASLGARLIVQALAAPRLEPVPQPVEGITYAHKVDKAEAAIDWSRPAAEIERRTRAFDPFPGASFRLGDETVKLWRAEVRPGPVDAAAGTVLLAQADQFEVACADGRLALRQLQYPGGRRLAAAAFLQARPVKAGALLG